MKNIDLNNFIRFLSSKSFKKPDNFFFDNEIIELAFEETYEDVYYHKENISRDLLINNIIYNYSELAIFLFRFGNNIYKKDSSSISLDIIQSLMKEMCSCELYFSNHIGKGLFVQHGLGTIIGSRNNIGKGFRIFQNCTIGHRDKNSNGNTIGNNVICYAGSKILGSNRIGDGVVVGANTVVTKDIPDNMIAYGNPIIIKPIIKNSNIL